MCILMFIGASPGSTGGGVKTTTIFVMIQALKCMGRKKSAHAFKRSISEENISKAFMITVLSAGILCVATFLMCVFEPEYDFIQIIFEVASALSRTFHWNHARTWCGGKNPYYFIDVYRACRSLYPAFRMGQR